MSNRVGRVLGAFAIATSTMALTVPSAGAADTTTTFTITSGSLSISAPGAANLGTVALTTPTVSGGLGNVVVTDSRSLFVANWAATASSTNFTTGGATTAETVAKSLVTYTPGTATTTGTGTTATPAAAGTMGGASIPVMTTVASGNNSVTWNPTLTIAVGAQTVAGLYTGTITHSVS